MSRYIDADLLIDACWHLEEISIKHLDYKEANKYNVICRAVHGAPTADVQEVKHSTWKKVYLPIPLSDGCKESYECQNCFTHWDWEFKYCPNCGAKMDLK